MGEDLKEAYEGKDVYVLYFKNGEEVTKSIGIINDVIKKIDLILYITRMIWIKDP